MKNAEDKVIFSKNNQSALVTIKAKITGWQETLLAVWVLAWTFCGIVVIASFFGEYSRDEKLMMLVYIVFWLYFEYKAVYAFIWKKYGTEYIKIDEEGFLYKRDIMGYGTPKKYFKENISKLNAIDLKDRSFVQSYYNSFWMVGNETINFIYLGKTVGMALGLSNAKRDEVLKFLKHQKKVFHSK